MGRLGERDLTRLSFLMASLVASPDLWSRLIELVLRDEPASSAFRTVVAELRDLLAERGASGVPSISTLQEVAELLIHRDDEQRALGLALSAALESAPVQRAAAG
jgi:hypothetical protein